MVIIFVCVILSVSYILFGIELKSKKKREIEKNKWICEFFKQEVAGINKLQLVGEGNDGNSDFEFIQAVRKINLPNDVRVRIYD